MGIANALDRVLMDEQKGCRSRRSPDLNLPKHISKVCITRTQNPGEIAIEPTDVVEAKKAVNKRQEQGIDVFPK
jgi:hypothetical protein